MSSRPKEEEHLCMICLQSGAHILQLNCKCRMNVHSKCWKEYCEKKRIQECMLCHKKQEIKEDIDNSSFQNRCAACCCCCLLTEFFLQFI